MLPFQSSRKRLAYYCLLSLAVLLAFCSSFFIYLPGPTLPLDSLRHPPERWWPWSYPEWPTYVGNCGVILGILMTPVALVVVIRMLARLLSASFAKIRGQSICKPSIIGLLRPASIPLSFAAGFWVGLLLVIPLSYKYSAHRAQPILTALKRYVHDHPEHPSVMSVQQLVPRYLPEVLTPGTIGSARFSFSSGLGFDYPHAPGIFPDYRIEHYTGRYQDTYETRPTGFPNWRIRSAR